MGMDGEKMIVRWWRDGGRVVGRLWESGGEVLGNGNGRWEGDGGVGAQGVGKVMGGIYVVLGGL